MVYFRWQPTTSLQNFIYLRQSAAELLLFVQKSKMAAATILDLIFVQYFGIPACRTSRVIHLPIFVQICAIVNEFWAIDKIQNGGRRYLEFIIFVHFGQMAYFRWQPSTSLQNFIHLRQSAAELLMLAQKSKMAAAAILNYNFVMLDHPRSLFVHLKFPLKFHVDRVRTFRDIAIRKFRNILADFSGEKISDFLMVHSVVFIYFWATAGPPNVAGPWVVYPDFILSMGLLTAVDQLATSTVGAKQSRVAPVASWSCVVCYKVAK